MYGEGLFDVDVVVFFVYCECFVDVFVLLVDYYVFEYLEMFFGVFDYFDMYVDGVVWVECWDVVV